MSVTYCEHIQDNLLMCKQITSPFDGVIKKLYYEADDMAIVGKVSHAQDLPIKPI